MSESRVVVVTGAARGIGRAAAVAFASAGYQVAGADSAAPASSVLDYAPASPGDLEKDERSAADAMSEKLPLGVPWVEPEDIAPLVVFLASQEAHMVTGTSFAATGGDSANITA